MKWLINGLGATLRPFLRLPGIANRQGFSYVPVRLVPVCNPAAVRRVDLHIYWTMRCASVLDTTSVVREIGRRLGRSPGSNLRSHRRGRTDPLRPLPKGRGEGWRAISLQLSCLGMQLWNQVNGLPLASDRPSILAAIPALHTHHRPSVAERKFCWR